MSANTTIKTTLSVLLLRETAKEFGIDLKTIEETSINGLIEYHAMNREEV